jgi:multiple antibiotic resistance protein
MGATILLVAGAEGDLATIGIVIASLVAMLFLTFVLMLLAAQIQRLLGVTGLHVIARVFGVLLAALAVQFIFDGLANSGLFSRV